MARAQTTTYIAGLVPTVFVIFGVTGDLSRRKLIPALFHLYRNQYLPERLRIVGFSRQELSHAQFQAYVSDIISATGTGTAEQRAAFAELFLYQPGTFAEGTSYLSLSESLIELERTAFGQCTNKLFYLAVAPTHYETILRNLANAGLTIPCGGELGWTRVLVEKPFGKDLATAVELDRLLGLLFKEEQIFRIDHYLAKETLQNILAFRFSNSLFEALWSSEHIEKVEIQFWEAGGIGTRGQFYEDVGALRDVGQNHLLQMLALIAMDHPGKLDATAIRAERARILEHVVPLSPHALHEQTVRAQYRGYRAEADVQASSQIETYFRLQAELDTPRWRGVPFFLESGKKMPEDAVKISVFFRESGPCLCPPGEEHQHQNVLTFHMQPTQGISIVFWAKRPGFGMQLDAKKLSFSYNESHDGLNIPDAYEHVLFDCIRGDQTLFTSTAEVQAAWSFITPILAGWQDTPLHEYEPGTRGPRLPDVTR